MQSLPPFPPSPQLPLGFRSLRNRAFLARVNLLSQLLPSLDVTDRRGTARSLLVSIKLYLSYDFFSYDKHDKYDRYNDMETRL